MYTLLQKKMCDKKISVIFTDKKTCDFIWMTAFVMQFSIGT